MSYQNGNDGDVWKYNPQIGDYEIMPKTPDYGEPIRLDDYLNVCKANGEVVMEDIDAFRHSDHLQRYISCVNACRGIADPEKVVPLMVEFVKVARSYRSMKNSMYKEFGVTAARYKELLDQISEATNE